MNANEFLWKINLILMMKHNTHRLLAVFGIFFFIGCGSNDMPSMDEEPDDDVFIFEDPGKVASACYPAFEDDELNVVTWNIENFPMTSTTKTKPHRKNRIISTRKRG